MSWRVIALCIPLMGCAFALTGCEGRGDKPKPDVDNAVIAEKLDKLLEKLEVSADPALKQRVENLEKSFETLNEMANDSSAKLLDLARIVKTSDNRDMYAAKILDAMRSSKEFEGEMKEAVHSTMQREGTVRVVNETPTYKFVRINGGTQKHVNAFSERVFHNIPVGTFTLELVGHEPRRNWTLAPPDYQQVIEINVR